MSVFQSFHNLFLQQMDARINAVSWSEAGQTVAESWSNVAQARVGSKEPWPLIFR